MLSRVASVGVRSRYVCGIQGTTRMEHTMDVMNVTVVNGVTYPACKDCIHFDRGDATGSSIIYGTCKAYRLQNLITGNVKNEFATVARADFSKCGKVGREFKSATDEMTKEWERIYKYTYN